MTKPESRRSSARSGCAAPAPTAALLREYALRHLDRYATSEAGLLRVLDRRIQRWERLAGELVEGDEGMTIESAKRAALHDAREVVKALATVGIIDDAAFGRSRAATLASAGRSRRAVDAHLRARGVDPTQIAMDEPERQASELPAALIYVRRRRLGAFNPNAGDANVRRRELAALARAGFTAAIAGQALSMDQDAAIALVLRFRRGETML